MSTNEAISLEDRAELKRKQIKQQHEELAADYLSLAKLRELGFYNDEAQMYYKKAEEELAMAKAVSSK